MAISRLDQPSQTTTTKATTYDRILSQLSLLQRGHENIHITYNSTANVAILKDGSTYEVNGQMYVNEGDLMLPSPTTYQQTDQNERMLTLRCTSGTSFSWVNDTGATFNLSNISSKGGWYSSSTTRVFSSFVFVKQRDSIERAITQTVSLPLYTKIMRHPFENPPSLAGYLGTWVNRSSESTACFFRVEGSRTLNGVTHTARGFESTTQTIQNDMMIDFSKNASGNDSTFTAIGPRIGVTRPVPSGVFVRDDVQAGNSYGDNTSPASEITLDLSANVSSARLGDEVRPINITVQIWQRTA